MLYYGYEYFCGANVSVSIDNFGLIECAGLQYEVQESKIPIYGYSSRHYDAIASGQVIVQGTLLVNYIHQDYLLQAINYSLKGGAASAPSPQPVINALPVSLSEAFLNMPAQGQAVVGEALRRNWEQTTSVPPNTQTNTSTIHNRRNPHDVFGGADIKVRFGETSDARPNGVTGLLIHDCNFTSRGQVIKVDEEVMVEAYRFFARDVFSLRNPT